MKRYQIPTADKNHFNEMFLKLRKLGFVYASERFKTIKEIDNKYKYYSVIRVGYDSDCTMILHGIETLWNVGDYPSVTVDYFINNVFPTW